MEEKITIIEGPAPTFELVEEGWANGVLEGPSLYSVAVTQLRTFNGGELVERCYRAWKRHENINLEYKTDDGPQEAAIVAARSTETEDGQVLILWVRLPDEEIELAMDYDDDFDEGEEDYGDPLV